MLGTTLSFANLHHHGDLFGNILDLRTFRSEIAFDPKKHCDAYDTPQSRWLAIHAPDGRVLASLRMTPTTAQCGIYSYMIRDAQCGLIDDLPAHVLYGDAPIEKGLWEVTRGFVSPDLTKAERDEVFKKLAREVIATVRAEGIRTLLTLLPESWGDWGRPSLLSSDVAGPEVEIEDEAHQAKIIETQHLLH